MQGDCITKGESMKARGANFVKDAVLAVLMGYFVGHAIPWVNTAGAFTGGFLAAELTMFFLTAYDEIIRQRTRRRGKR